MKQTIQVFAHNHFSGNLTFNKLENEYLFNYVNDNFISLSMPYREKTYVSQFGLHPVFDMNMPEGYLYELLKKYLLKELKELDDFTLFAYLSPQIEGMLTYKTEQKHQQLQSNFILEDIISSEDDDIFSILIKTFLKKSFISGVQPKVLATLREKVTLNDREFIIKTFGNEYPCLAENEFFCMKAIAHAGIPVPSFYLSHNKKLFIIERFDYDKSSNTFLGFEDMCVLSKQKKEQKYKGSYEKIAQIIHKVSTSRLEDLEIFFKMIVMNYLLKNGDAHLKNFGIIYTHDLSTRRLAPAYDVINTLIYLKTDKPALSLFSKNVWMNQEKLEKFGITYCFLSQKETKQIYQKCVQAVNKIVISIENYIDKKENDHFINTGEAMIHYLKSSLIQTETLKEVPYTQGHQK